MSDVTRILNLVQQGDPEAAEELFPLVYDELRKLVAHRMRVKRPARPCKPQRWFMNLGFAWFGHRWSDWFAGLLAGLLNFLSDSSILWRAWGIDFVK
jgi:ECF sigma factor